MAIARQNKRETDIVEGVDLSEIDIAVANAQKASDASGREPKVGNAHKDDKPQGQSKWRRTLIVIAVVLASLVMALSILLPSLSAVIEAFTSGSDTTEEAATTEAAESDDASTEDATTEDSEADAYQEYIDTIDERYGTTAESLEAKVEADATDKASLINLANTYYQWGTSLSNFTTTDEQTLHMQEKLEAAITTYDKYLALEDSNAAQVSKIMCNYYLGNVDAAIIDLEAFCAKTANYAPAWSDLGMMYNAKGETDKALEAYNKVVEVDPNDTYGLKSSAESQITSLSASTEAATEE